MARNTSKDPKANEKPQGFVDKLLHGDHGHATESEEKEVGPKEGDSPAPAADPVDPVAPAIESKQASADANAATDMSAHPKFAKFKKGNPTDGNK